MRILIITPTFFTDGSGAATYYKILARWLTDKGHNVSVISEKESNPETWVDYYGLFPKRCGRSKSYRDVIDYALQNVQYLQTVFVTSKLMPDVILVHTSFYNKIGIFPAVMEMLHHILGEKTLLVADFRDTLLPRSRFRHLKIFRFYIACSKKVSSYLRNNKIDHSRIVEIPVPQERIVVDKVEAKKYLKQKKLYGVGYIYYAGLIKEEKLTDRLLKAYIGYVRPKLPDCKLVLSGYIKTMSKKIQKQLHNEGVEYLGNLSRREVIHVIWGSRLCVNISPIESLPRFAIEAMALNKPVLLPAGIPEFNCCREFVINSNDPAYIGEKIIEVYLSERRPDYPIDAHRPSVVMPLYEKILAYQK